VILPHDILHVPFYPPAQQITRRDGEEIYRSPDWSQAPEITREIKALFRKGEHHVLLADRGDYTGARLTEALMNWLRQIHASFRVLAMLPGIYNFSASQRAVAEVDEWLGDFPEFQSLNTKGLPEVDSEMSLMEFTALAKAKLLRLYRERKH